MKFLRTIKGRLFTTLAFLIGSTMAVGAIAVTIFGSFGSASKALINETLPSLESAYVLEKLAVDLTQAGTLLMAAPSKTVLDTAYKKYSDEIKTLRNLTANISANGTYDDILSLNRYSQGVPSNLDMTFAVKSHLLELQSEYSRAVTVALALFKDAAPESFLQLYSRLHLLAGLDTEADVAELQNSFVTLDGAVFSAPPSKAVIAHLDSPTGPFAIRRKQLQLNGIVAAALEHLRRDADGLAEATKDYRATISSAVGREATTLFQLQELGASAIGGLTGLSGIVAVLIGWFVVNRGIAERLSALGAVMTDRANRPALKDVTSFGDDEISDMARSMGGYIARSQELVLAQTALDQTEDCVFMFDPENCEFFYVNHGGKKQVGYDGNELLTVRAFDITPELDEDDFRAMIAPLMSGPQSSMTFETLHRHKNGNDIPVEVGLQYVRPSDDSPFFLAIARDISLRLKAKQDLIEARNAAESASQAKSRFLSSMSHELRTPLNAIMGFGQLLKTDVEYPLSHSQQTAVAHILASSTHLLELISQVLDLAKIESGNFTVSVAPVDIEPVLTECLNMASILALKKGLAIHKDLPEPTSLPFVSADRTRLRQALINLLSNAAKYNVEGGSITLSCAPGKPGMFRFSVADTGRGIPERLHGKIFVPFDRLSAEGSTIEGTGIGLNITRQIVEMMDGEIGFTSAEGEGSTFWFELPVSEGAAARPLPSPVDTQDAAPTNVAAPASHAVLYVEEHPAHIKLMERILGRISGTTLHSAHSVERGIEMANASLPSLILLNMNLPGMDGREAVKQLRADTRTRDVPLFAVSADASPEDIRLAIEMGYDEHIAKPFSIPDVTKKIKRVLHPHT